MSVPYPPNAYQTNPYQPQPQPQVRFEWINEAWQLFTANAGVWIVSILITLVVCYGVMLVGLYGFGISQAVAASRTSGNPFGSEFAMPAYWVTVLLFSLISAFFVGGLLQMANAQVRRQPINIGMLFGGGKMVLPLFGFQILFGIASYIGTLLLVLPLFIVTGLLAPAYALIADGVPVGEAMSRSMNAMKSQWLMAGVFAFVYTLLIAVSAVLCGLGLFATYPMAAIIVALVYRDMIGMPLGNTAPVDANVYGAAQPGVWPPAPGSQPPYGGPAPVPYTPDPAQPQSPTSSAMPPFYQTPLAGAPESRNPIEPEIGGENGSGTLPPSPPSTPGV